MSDVGMLKLSESEVEVVGGDVIFSDAMFVYSSSTVSCKIEEIPQLIEYLKKVYDEHNANKASQ